MKLQVAKNIQFSRLIKANGRLCEFNFRKMTGLNSGLFSVDVADDRGNRILFTMGKENGFWKIATTDIPSWISSAVQHLHEKIEEIMVIQPSHENHANFPDSNIIDQNKLS